MSANTISQTHQNQVLASPEICEAAISTLFAQNDTTEDNLELQTSSYSVITSNAEGKIRCLKKYCEDYENILPLFTGLDEHHESILSPSTPHLDLFEDIQTLCEKQVYYKSSESLGFYSQTVKDNKNNNINDDEESKVASKQIKNLSSKIYKSSMIRNEEDLAYTSENGDGEGSRNLISKFKPRKYWKMDYTRPSRRSDVVMRGLFRLMIKVIKDEYRQFHLSNGFKITHEDIVKGTSLYVSQKFDTENYNSGEIDKLADELYSLAYPMIYSKNILKGKMTKYQDVATNFALNKLKDLLLDFTSRCVLVNFSHLNNEDKMRLTLRARPSTRNNFEAYWEALGFFKTL